eukprot:gene49676-9835_t
MPQQQQPMPQQPVQQRPPMPLLNNWNWWFFKGPPTKEQIEKAKAGDKD